MASMSKAASISARIALVQGSAPKMPNFSDDWRGSRPVAELIENRQHVARGDRDDVGLEIGDQLHLPLVMPPEIGTTVQPEPLGAVMRPEAASEQAIAVGVVHDHAAAPPAARIERAITPTHLDVGLV